ncbi:MAG: phosphate ABC transporter permease PstA [Desulfitobacteriaceae bacterium]|nr:phosphate ABC transporter permease PstA [Desulfitobacteriaceae bacterium]MDI6913615.1 phosphate ABC transporter permease PstA [Desulfitobacteriaceae bacterium]
MSYPIRKYRNLGMLALLIFATLIALVPLFGVLWYVIKNGITSLNFSFFVHLPKPLGMPGGGMANAIVGTLIMVGIGGLIGIPIGILSAVYLTEYGRASWFSTVVRFTTDVLTGIPSIIIGIVVYTSLVLKMRHFSAIAGGVALAVIIIPQVVRSTEEMLKLVPHSIREAAAALGIPKWRTIMQVVIPSAAKGIVTGAMLGIARIAGETAPLLFTALGNTYWAHSINEPIAALPLQIYQYAISPYESWHQQAWAGSLVLIGLVLVLSITARLAFRSNYK